MIVEMPDPIPYDALEGTNYQVVNGKIRYFPPSTPGRSIPAAWIKCDRCGRVVPGIKYNAGKYCSAACTYEDRKGEKHVNYKGRVVAKNGYVRVTNPETGGRRQEHRVVMEQKLGRPLENFEHVHHINGNRADNRPENLELRHVNDHPAGVRVYDKIKDLCGSLNKDEMVTLAKWLLERATKK